MTKTGRPRRYDCTPDRPPFTDFADTSIALAACRLEELRARVRDQIDDLPPDGLRFRCPGTELTVEWLAAHLVWAELGWMRRLAPDTPIEGAAHFEARIGWAGTMAYQESATDRRTGGTSLTAAELVGLIERLENEVTLPVLKVLPTPASPTSHPALTTVEKALNHLLWHWSYHSGQIGLLRLMWGSDYEWRF